MKVSSFIKHWPFLTWTFVAVLLSGISYLVEPQYDVFPEGILILAMPLYAPMFYIPAEIIGELTNHSRSSLLLIPILSIGFGTALLLDLLLHRFIKWKKRLHSNNFKQ